MYEKHIFIYESCLLIIMNPTENETLGLGLNLIEGFNLILLGKWSDRIKKAMPLRVQAVINEMDKVLC